MFVKVDGKVADLFCSGHHREISLTSFAHELRMKDWIFSFRGYLQGLFIVLLAAYIWVFPGRFLGGTRFETVPDIFGIASLIFGATLRIWAVSHAGRHTRSRSIKAPSLITTGPYSCVRNPIYLGNFFIGLGLVVLAKALLLIPVYLAIFAIQYRKIVEKEERFLRHKFGERFERYCHVAPRWVPSCKRIAAALTFGSNFYLKELGTTIGVLIGAVVFEWMESPLHRAWVATLYRWVTK
jgi:protein-S-isoprenylcysteine O-methyltransferase Ste14